MLLVDDYTRMTAVCFLRKKSEAFENFKIYKEMVENEMDSKIKCLRSDNGGEFTSKEFMDFCSKHGIKRKFFIARTPQQNGVVERKNMTSTGNGSNYVNGFQVDRCLLGTCSAYNSSYSKQSNAQKQQ
jgi:transposase InsO family protein